MLVRWSGHQSFEKRHTRIIAARFTLWLNNFREDVLKQLPDKLKSKLPEVPSKGDLDIQQLRDSEFFFA